MKTATITKSQVKTRFGYKSLFTVNYGEFVKTAGSQYATFESLNQAKAACKRNGFNFLTY